MKAYWTIRMDVGDPLHTRADTFTYRGTLPHAYTTAVTLLRQVAMEWFNDYRRAPDRCRVRLEFRERYERKP